MEVKQLPWMNGTDCGCCVIVWLSDVTQRPYVKGWVSSAALVGDGRGLKRSGRVRDLQALKGCP